jgi:hypothetical protein
MVLPSWQAPQLPKAGLAVDTTQTGLEGNLAHWMSEVHATQTELTQLAAEMLVQSESCRHATQVPA